MNTEQRTQHHQDSPQPQQSHDKVLAVLSHEIRNPLAAVVNGVQILRQSGTSGPIAEQTLDLIERQLKQVIQLMDDLLQPAGRREGAKSEAATDEPLPRGLHPSPLRLLVVEDNRDVAKSLTSLLRLWGHEVSVAYDGVQALTVADAHRPQIVLLDLDLPGLDGFTVARHLKGSSQWKPGRLIALTASGDEDHRRRVREAGFDFHLVKPVAPTVLKKLLASFNGHPSAPPSPSPLP
jgi:CheY-like chemotaxis protein